MWVPRIKLFRPTVVQKGRRIKVQIWNMRWTDQYGKVVSKTTGTANRDAAELVRQDWFGKLLQVGSNPAACYDLTWAKVVDEFIMTKRHTLRPSTLDIYDRAAKKFATVTKLAKLRQVNTAMLERFAADRSDEVGAASVNKEIRHVRSIIRWAYRRHYIEHLPDFSCAFVREDYKLPVLIPKATYKAILATLATQEIRLRHRSAAWWTVFVRLAWGLGLRRSELLGLAWERVDLEGAEVLVSYSTSKGRRDRRLPLTADLVGLLRGWDSGDPLVLPAECGIRQVYDDWWAILDEAKVGRIAFKHFRSTTASELLMSGCSTIMAKEWLGHSTTLVLERHYANVLPGLRAAAEARLNGRK